MKPYDSANTFEYIESFQYIVYNNSYSNWIDQLTYIEYNTKQ